jgi:hypothetical protein
MSFISTVQFNEFLECLQRTTAVNRLASDSDTLLDALLALFKHLNTKGSVSQHDVFLGWQGSVLEYAVEDGCSLFFGSTTNQFIGLGNLEAMVLRFEDTLVVLSSHLEIAGQ